jgi:hypothetical protein
MKNLITIIILITSLKSYSEAGLTIEPVYGVERTQREFPKPAKYRTTKFLGARALYGVPEFSAELEVNQANSREEFPDSNLKVEYQTQKVLFGFRTYPIKSEHLGMFLRFGARGTQEKREIEENGVSRTEESPIRFDPYAGTGITIVGGRMFALNAGATLVYNRNAVNDDEKFDTRYTFSFSIKAGNR